MLDTSLCIALLRDRPMSLRERFNLEAEGLCISTIILTELLQGAEKSARPEHKRREVENFAARLEVLAHDPEAAGHAANIKATLERAGEIIDSYDLLIAGHARSKGLVVVTANVGEFSRVEGLRVEDWLSTGSDP